MKRLSISYLGFAGLSLVAALGSGRAESAVPALTPTLSPNAAPRLGSKEGSAQLLATIAEARARSPRTFEAVARVRDKVVELDAKKRGPLAPIGAHLSNLGPDAFAALAERIAQPDALLSGTAARAWRAGLVETIGALRDPRAFEVLAPLLDDSDDLIIRLSAEGIGKLSSDAATTLLISRLDREAVVLGAGHCRRRAMATALSGVVARRASPAMVKAAVRALGDAGSAWAWNTRRVPVAAEEADVRAISAAALLDAFVGFDGEVRQAASNALMVVDDPGTPARIAAAKVAASTDTVAALDKLAARFARNPTRL